MSWFPLVGLLAEALEWWLSVMTRRWLSCHLARIACRYGHHTNSIYSYDGHQNHSIELTSAAKNENLDAVLTDSSATPLLTVSIHLSDQEIAHSSDLSTNRSTRDDCLQLSAADPNCCSFFSSHQKSHFPAVDSAETKLRQMVLPGSCSSEFASPCSSALPSCPQSNSDLAAAAPPLNTSVDGHSNNAMGLGAVQQQRTDQQGQPTSSSIVHRLRPQVPPKPQIDIVRYSMANAKDDLDLDTILSELLELENQLSSEANDHLLLHGLPSLPSSNSNNKLNNIAFQQPRTTPTPYGYSNGPVAQEPLVLINNTAFQQRKPQSNCSSLLQLGGVNSECELSATRLHTDLCTSPDADSAFGDSSSTECASSGSSGAGRGTNRCRNSEISSADSYRGSLNTPSPTQTHQASPNSVDVSSSTVRAPSALSSVAGGDIKAQKIREALEKMKEAKMKKIYVKIFLEDGTTKGLLIDERWNVLETMKQLAEKQKVTLTPEHVILEEYPDLHFKRIYEDHEFVVENIEDWLADSKNKLYFIRMPDKYNFLRTPQEFLLTEKSKYAEKFPQLDSPEWTSDLKQSLVTLFAESENNAVPEMEGWLLLKSDGKKSWKKHYFVLRSSGLYYYPKCGKMRGTKDLQCLMNVYNNQVYTCLDWKKKYKAPTNYGFAIKHPRIQVKTSKYIKYICAEDEKSFNKWIAALRITRNGFQTLFKNYCLMQSEARTSQPPAPIRVETPQIPLQRLSSLDHSALSSASFTPKHNYSNSIASLNSPIEKPSSGSPMRQIPSMLNSPRISLLSQTTPNNGRGSPASIVFDQDECGTIKRQPYATDIPQYAQFARPASSNTQIGNSAMCSSTPSTSSNGTCCYKGPVECECHVVSLGQPDSDSDEEDQLPPPPSQGSVQRIALPATPRSMPAPFVPPKPTSLVASPNISNGIADYGDLSKSTPRKVPPPPPPKRSDVTQLQNGMQHAISYMQPQSALTQPQMELYSELQKATARQKQRIEGN
ncbi:PH domain-containing protein [Ditylenchus destructor]|nr:PH domain-containing protein [Ditylenchus destructor]